MDPEEIKDGAEKDPPEEKTEESISSGEETPVSEKNAPEESAASENAEVAILDENTANAMIAEPMKQDTPEETVTSEAQDTIETPAEEAVTESVAEEPSEENSVAPSLVGAFVQAAPAEDKEAANEGAEAGAEEKQPLSETAGRRFRIAGIILCLAAIAIMIISLIVIMNADQVTGHYNGTAWYTEYAHGELSISGNNAFPESLATRESAIAERFSYGNSDELYAAGAGACEDSSYYFLADPTDSGHLCRISKKDNGKKVKLCDISAENLNILYGRIYFINHFTADGDSAGIYSIARDGSGLKLLMDGSFYSLRMVNDWLYYISGEDGSIRRMNIHGLSEEVLCNEDCNDLWVAGNSIYYISQDKERPVSERMVICSMSVDGTERTEIVKRGYYNALSYHDGILYYSVYNSGYGWLDTTWKEEEPAEGDGPVIIPQLQVPHEGFVELKGIYSPVIVHGGDMWYIDRSDLRSLSVYTPEGGRIRHYDTENIVSVYLMSDLIVIRWLKDGITPLVSVNRLNTGEMVDLFGSVSEE